MMHRTCFLFLGSYLVIISVPADAIDPQFVLPHRGCYLLSGTLHGLSNDGFKLSDVQPILCTYVVFGFTFIEGNELRSSRADEEHLQIMNMMRKVNPTMNILLALDLGSEKNADELTTNLIHSQNRTEFVGTIIGKLRAWSLDGIAIHVENISYASANVVALLLKDLRTKFDQESVESSLSRLAIIMNVGISPRTVKMDPVILASEADYVQIRAWDFNTPQSEPAKTGHNSPLYRGLGSLSSADPLNNIDHAFSEWYSSGIPKSKLILGMTFYGQAWNLANKNRFEAGAPADGKAPAFGYSNSQGILYYHDICEQIRDGKLTKVFDSDGMVPFAHNDSLWVSYEDVESARIKARWILEKNYSGVFFWDLSMEDFNGTCDEKPFTVMQAVYDIFSIASQTNTGEKLECDRQFCTKRGAGVFALGSCSDSYCNCDYGGKAYKFPCGPGTIFDSLILGCNYAYNIKGCENATKGIV